MKGMNMNRNTQSYKVDVIMRNQLLPVGTLLLFALILGIMLPQPGAAFDQSAYPPATTIPIIYDTDMGPDIDDVGALAILHQFANDGICSIIAIGVDSPEPYSACCVDAINTYYKRPDIPIGIVKNGPGTPTAQEYPKAITEQFPNDLKNSMNNIPNAVTVYRQALVKQADKSVVIVAVGYKTILSQLLNSPADTISSLNGKDLIMKKVLLWVDMGGGYPSGHEWNFYCDIAGTYDAVTNWPTPVVFSGYEIGFPINSGSLLSSKTPIDNPVRKGYEINVGVGSGKSSWDLTAALYACRGLGAFWDVHNTGHNQIDNGAWPNGGDNQWIDQNLPGIDHSYLVAKMSNAGVGAVLDSLLVLPPKSTPTKIAFPISQSKHSYRGDLSGSPWIYDLKGSKMKGDKISRRIYREDFRSSAK
jgi:hypothetical protein